MHFNTSQPIDKEEALNTQEANNIDENPIQAESKPAEKKTTQTYIIILTQFIAKRNPFEKTVDDSIKICSHYHLV